MGLEKIERMVKDVATDTKAVHTTVKELEAAQKATDARMKAHEEKMAAIGVAGFGDVKPENARYQKAFMVEDFLRVAHDLCIHKRVHEDELQYNKAKANGVELYPAEHFEKVMQAELQGDGGFAVPDFMDSEIIKRLKATQVLESMGIRSFTVPPKFGSFAVPRLISGATYSEGGEIAVPPLSTPQLDELVANPKQSFSGIEMSLDLIGMNAVGLDDVIMEDVTDDAGLRADFLGLEGTGTAFQPRGLFNTPGIGSFDAGNPNGGNISLDLLIELQKIVASANSNMRSTGYVMHSRLFYEIMKITEGAAPGFHVFPSVQFAPGVAARPQKQVLGEPIGLFNQLDVTRTKGSGTDQSAVFFGDWSDLMLIRWGTFSVKVTEEATHPTSGRSAFWQNLRAFRFAQTLDYIVRQAPSFAVSSDVNTNP